MPYTSGTITIGLPTSNYLNCDAAIADYTGGIVGLSGNLTWIIEADTTWTSNFNLYDHNGYTFKVTSETPHNGNVNAGFYITVDAAVEVYVAVATTGTTVIEKVKMKGGANLYLMNRSSVGTDSAANVILRNLIVVDLSIWVKQQEIRFVRQLAYNNLLINSIFYYDYVYGTTPHVCDTSIFENNSIGYEGAAGSSRIMMTGGAGNVSKANLILRNNVIRIAVGGFGIEGFQLVNQGLKKPIAYNNASSNATAITPIGGTWDAASSGNISGILDNEFESLIEASADFMKLAKGHLLSNPVVDPDKGQSPLRCVFGGNTEYDYSGKVLPSGGQVPTLSATDLAGMAYGKYGDYPIGCYNAEVAY